VTYYLDASAIVPLFKDEGTAVKVGKALDSWVAAALDLVILFDEVIKAAASSVRTPFPKLLMPDAIHLAICKRLDLTLVTLDKDMFTIAKREGVAAIYPA
jgi:predicted nucleic acid-binding protein